MKAVPTPFFLQGSQGRCFAVHHRPHESIQTWGHVVCVPAFNEDMNRCRTMVTLQAQEFAKHGIGTLVIDLFGTGESDGQYVDARWETWIDDVKRGIEWLDQQPGACRGLLGIRLGVALAAEVLRQQGDRRLALIAWQAIPDGKSYFTQFLRMRVAANMDRTDLPKETTADMRRQLANGDPIEIAGYEIHPQLAAAIECQQLAALAPPAGTPIAWFEKLTPVAEGMAPASEKVLQAWRQETGSITATHFDGPAFWALYDRALAHELIAQTTAWTVALRRSA